MKDPRVLGKVKHELEDVLRIALTGVLTSCDNYDEISDFIEERRTELKDTGILTRGGNINIRVSQTFGRQTYNPKHVKEEQLS